MSCADRFRNSSTCKVSSEWTARSLVGARPTGKIPVRTVPHGRLLSEAKLVPDTLKARFVRALPKKLIGYRAYDSDPLDTGLASAASTSSHAISSRERSSRRLISDARAPWGHDGGPTGGGVADFIPAGRAEHLHSSVPGGASASFGQCPMDELDADRPLADGRCDALDAVRSVVPQPVRTNYGDRRQQCEKGWG